MAAENEEKYEQTFVVGDKAELTLRNVRGSVEVVGWDRPEVHVVAVKRMGTEWGAHDAFEETTVRMEQDANRIRVRTYRADHVGLFGWLGIGRTPPEVSYTVQVPVTSDVSVRTIGGDIALSSIRGTVYSKTVSGNIELRSVSGHIIVSGISGRVKGSELSGNLAAKSVSGEVFVGLSHLSGLWSKTVSGSVDVETTIDPAGTYELSSVSGSFMLSIPPDSRATARLRASSGRAACDIPCRVTEQERGRWEAVLNGGGASIELKTVSGDLHIRPSSLAAEGGAPVQETPAAGAAEGWPEMAILKAVERGEMSVEAAVAKLAELDRVE